MHMVAHMTIHINTHGNAHTHTHINTHISTHANIHNPIDVSMQKHNHLHGQATANTQAYSVHTHTSHEIWLLCQMKYNRFCSENDYFFENLHASGRVSFWCCTNKNIFNKK